MSNTSRLKQSLGTTRNTYLGKQDGRTDVLSPRAGWILSGRKKNTLKNLGVPSNHTRASNNGATALYIYRQGCRLDTE